MQQSVNSFRPLTYLNNKPASLIKVLQQAWLKEWRLQVRRKGDLINPLIFFALVVVLFPLGISPTEEVLAPVAPGVLWVAALLAVLMSLDALFRPDLQDGSLEQLLLNGYSPALQSLIKVLVHWLLSCMPLVALAPFLGIMLYLPWQALLSLSLSLMLGSFSLSLLGALGAALTTGIGKSGVLLTLLVLPFYIPVLIFGTGAMQAAISGYSSLPQLAILAALALLALTLTPWGIAAALKLAVTSE